MKKTTIFCISFLMLFAANLSSFGASNNNLNSPVGKKKVDVSASVSDAEIRVNGKLLGKGNLEVIVESKACTTVIISKVGYLTEKIEFCNQKGMPVPPKSFHAEMRRDDSYDASIQTDIANIDIELKATKGKDKSWKLINQIVLGYIDVIEMTDKETGYLRTSWSLKTFTQNTIRTRIIIKEASTEPLVFKVKLVSEYSGIPMTSVKSDELYKEWDRVLRSYSNVITELQARVK